MRRTPQAPRVSVVVVTRDRRAGLLGCLERLVALPERPPVIVVDNGSRDGTPAAVRRRFPGVDLVTLGYNAGSAGRTAGVRCAGTPYVAFSDDDSWWEPDSLARAAGVLDAHADVALLAARILIHPDARPDPVCTAMAASPLGEVAGVGPRVLGFVACGAVARRDAYLAVGGFHPRYGVGGEEDLLALDLSAAGWACCYADELVAHHQPSPVRDVSARRRRELRNALWTTWLRSPTGRALRRSPHVLRAPDGGARLPLLAAADALGGVGWVRRERRPVPATVAALRDRLDRHEKCSQAQTHFR